MNKAFRHTIKYAFALLMIISLGLVLAGCGASGWKYDPITDVNDLEGRRVGVNLAWESDYYLTGREDMKLSRYDTTSDMIMALKYDKIDVIALDEDSIKLMLSQSGGIERVEPAFGKVNSIMYFGADDKQLTEDFNKFLAEYKKTDGYKDMLRRLDEFDGTEYIGEDIPLTGKGKVIRVVADPDNFPRAFLNPGSDILTGYDTELIKHYANDRGYQLEFIYSNYDDGVIGLKKGLYDVMTGYASDVYAEDVETVGLYVCDSMFDYSLYFLQKNREDITPDTSLMD